MPIHVAIDDKKATITPRGNLDRSIGRAFRESYELLLCRQRVDRIDVDLGAVDYVDSSALGYLLILREKTEDAEITVRLVNSQGIVRALLEMAGFHQLFAVR